MFFFRIYKLYFVYILLRPSTSLLPSGRPYNPGLIVVPPPERPNKGLTYDLFDLWVFAVTQLTSSRFFSDVRD